MTSSKIKRQVIWFLEFMQATLLLTFNRARLRHLENVNRMHLSFCTKTCQPPCWHSTMKMRKCNSKFSNWTLTLKKVLHLQEWCTKNWNSYGFQTRLRGKRVPNLKPCRSCSEFMITQYQNLQTIYFVLNF